MSKISDSRPDEHAPINRLTMTVFTLTPLAALILVPWYGLTHGYSAWAWVSLVVFLFACGISITAGYHRLWSHQTYQAHAAVRWVFAVFGAMALQNSILIWGSQHRRHHLFVDDVDRDPYSAKRGFWFSHMGWILRDYPSGRNDFSNARDLERDPVVAFQHRYYLPLTLAMNIGLPLALGWAVGDVWGVFLLGGLLRLVVNHHIFQNDYRNGVKWWQYDPTKWLIRTLSWMGLASNLKRVPGLWIQRAQLAMQFRRMERALETRRGRPGDEVPAAEVGRDELPAAAQADRDRPAPPAAPVACHQPCVCLIASCAALPVTRGGFRRSSGSRATAAAAGARSRARPPRKGLEAPSRCARARS